MPTRHPEIFAALIAPFDSQEVKERQGQGGKKLHYITARTAQNRFDAVVGPENWKPEYTETKDGMKCRISVRIPGTDEWIPKEDGGGFADMPAEDDTEKSGFADAFKRAAVVWGVGRYLYRVGVTNYSGSTAPIEHAIESNGFIRQPDPTQPAPAPAPASNGQFGRLPSSGRQFFPWMKDMEGKYGVGLVNYMTQWSKSSGLPFKSSEWDDEQFQIGLAEACRKLTDGASPAVPTADMSAQRNGDMPAEFVPDGTIACPSEGRFLYMAAKKQEEATGMSFVNSITAWGKATGKAYKMGDWTGQDLKDGWRYLCWKVQSAAGPVATPTPVATNGAADGSLKREVFAKAKQHHKVVYQADATDDEARASVLKVFGDLYPTSLLANSDAAKLANLSRTFDELIVEAKGIPF